TRLARVTLGTGGPRLEQRDRLAELSDRLVVRRPRLRSLAGPAIVDDRVVDASRRLGVSGYHLRLALDALPAALDQHVHHPPVELLARALQQRPIRRLLHERVFEAVGRVRRLAAAEENLGVHEPPEAVS